MLRHPTELRPLRPKNPGNEIIAGVGNWCLKPVIPEGAEQSHAGFVANRQLVQNVVDLDFENRTVALAFQRDFPASSFGDELVVICLGLMNSIPPPPPLFECLQYPKGIQPR